MPHSLLHKQFVDGLTDPDAPLPDGVIDPQGRPAPKRYAVYRNNVTVSLIEGLKAGYPAIMALVGEELFTHLAREFVRANPPTSPVMLHFGKGFGPFLGKMNQLSKHPFLPDVARLERDWLQSYHAADAGVVEEAQMHALSDQEWARARFVSHPAARLLDSIFPIVDLFEAGRFGRKAAIDPDLQQWALITRPDLEVEVLAVSPTSGQFLKDLMDGVPLAVAVASRASDEGFDLQRVMSRVLQAGLFTDIDLGDDT